MIPQEQALNLQMRGRKMRILILLSILCGLSSQYASLAQTPNTPKISPMVARPYSTSNPNRDGKVREAEFNPNDLPRPINLPNLPGYTGTQYYINGLVYPNAKDGPGYMMVFNCENTKVQIKDWWQNALKMHKWNVSYSDSNTIKARDQDGSTCIITMQGPITTTKDKSKNVRAAYQIYYHQVVKEKR